MFLVIGVLALALLGGGLALLRTVSDTQAVERVEWAIEQIGTVDINARERVEGIERMYLALGVDLRPRVRNAGVLDEAIAQMRATVQAIDHAQRAIDAVLASRDCAAVVPAGTTYQALPFPSRAHVRDHAAFQELATKCTDEERAARRNTVRVTGTWWVNGVRESRGICSYDLRPTFSNLTDRAWARVTFTVSGHDAQGREIPDAAGSTSQYFTLDEGVGPGSDHKSRSTFTLRYDCATFDGFTIRRVEVLFANGDTRTAALDEIQLGSGWTKD
ncbi:hypothetical protein G7070_08915 [Propioniciclava coleopterorum]|uniref:Uncharacterized protein n=1 Tax=Propioniciclava coleopterorum TaxID=2714937 RepID=A0A6G7Y6U5_9ACTN|nr:hypothetical protein [Propioniciclava coleopterorum]QIK72368.1 hypothetical protein G7070_08915 [Propioniciclava coleopterorum]